MALPRGMEREAQRLFREGQSIGGVGTDTHLNAAAAYAISARDNWNDKSASASMVAIYLRAAELHAEAAHVTLALHYGD